MFVVYNESFPDLGHTVDVGHPIFLHLYDRIIQCASFICASHQSEESEVKPEGRYQ